MGFDVVEVGRESEPPVALFQLAPISHHFPLISTSLMSARDARSGSEVRSCLEFNVPRVFFILTVVSEVKTEDPLADFWPLLFLRFVRDSIINLVLVLKFAKPTFVIAGCIIVTMSFNADGSSCRS